MRLFRVRHAVGLVVVAAAVAASWPSTGGAAQTAAAQTAAPGTPGPVLTAAAGIAGQVDTTFGINGFATIPLGTWVAAAGDVIQPDGKIVAAGEAEINGTDALVVTRIDPGGQVDSSFGNDGVAVVSPPGGAGMDSGAGIALQSDGKIVIGGTARYQGSGPLAMTAFRLLPDGTPDPTFGVNGLAEVQIGSEGIANAVAVEPDGKILLSGVALIDHNEFAAVRLNPDGTLDPTFGSSGVTTLSPDGGAWGMVQEPGGEIVLGGEEDTPTSKKFMVARLLPNGGLDRSFANAGILELSIGSLSFATAVALEPDGRVVIAGSAVTSSGNIGAAIRLMPDGSFDPSFGTSGVATFPDYTVNAIAIDSSGRIVIAGVGASAGRLQPNGSVDRSFGDNGIAQAAVGSDDAANGLAIDPSTGDIVLAGVATISGRLELCVARLTAADSAAPAANGSPSSPTGQHLSSTRTKPRRPVAHKRRARRRVRRHHRRRRAHRHRRRQHR
jgi:uncharacterized delta-60 repeat protein